MSKTLKWILGITLGFVILVGVGFLVANFFGFGHMSYWGGPDSYGRPMMDGYGFDNRSPMDGFWNFRHPMMGGRGFGFFGMPFLFFGGLLRLIFPLGVLVLVAYFAYQQGKRAGMAAVQSVPAPASEETNTE